MAFVAVDYADRVALALELRGFDPSAPRSWYRSPRLGWRDLAFVSMVAALIALAALLQAGRPIA
jgi:energy-coupling factor transporter transmembrane protein EcfT